MRRFRTTIVVALATLLSVSICTAQQTATTSVPNLIRYSGTLKDAQGAALSSSSAVGVSFSIYKQQDGGAAVWMETQNVTLDSNGQYNVILGSTTATGLPDDLFSQQEQRWLGVQVQGQAEQARVLLVSVPYAFKAHEAETLGGLPASAFVKAAPTDASNGTSVNGLSAAANAGSTLERKDAAFRLPCPTVTATVDTPNVIPIWDPSSTCVLVSSIMSQLSPGEVEVSGNLNLSKAQAYLIGGFNALNLGNLQLSSVSGPSNLFVGVGAGAMNLTGTNNTFAGSGAGASNQTGKNNALYGYQAGYNNDVDFNSFFGSMAGYNNDAGMHNTFLGYKAGFFNTGGNNNTSIGYQAGSSNGQNASDNTFAGSNAGMSNVSGEQNVFMGSGAGTDNVGGDFNVFVGYKAGAVDDDGSHNVFVGTDAGASNEGGDFDIYIGANVQPSNGESQTIRIGTAGGANGQTFIGGIWNKYAIGGVPVYINSEGRLGTGIHPSPSGDSEELKELQRQHTVVAAQQDVIKAQQEQIQRQGQQIADLQQRLSRLESLIDKK